MATAPQLSPADTVRGWLSAGLKIRTRHIGEQAGLFGGDADQMIEVSHGRSLVVISEAEFSHIAATFNAAQPAGALLAGLQTPMNFGSGFWVNGDPE